MYEKSQTTYKRHKYEKNNCIQAPSVSRKNHHQHSSASRWLKYCAC